MVTFKPDPRIEAARYLAEAVTGVKAEHLFADGVVHCSAGRVDDVFQRAIRMHTTCGCERAVRLERARDILLGIPPAVPGELRFT